MIYCGSGHEERRQRESFGADVMSFMPTNHQGHAYYFFIMANSTLYPIAATEYPLIYLPTHTTVRNTKDRACELLPTRCLRTP